MHYGESAIYAQVGLIHTQPVPFHLIVHCDLVILFNAK